MMTGSIFMPPKPTLSKGAGAAPLLNWSMTYWAPLRAGTPKLSAAGPDRNVTMPRLKLSSAEAGMATLNAVAAMIGISLSAAALHGLRCIIVLLCGWSRRVPYAPVAPALVAGPSLGRLWRSVHDPIAPSAHRVPRRHGGRG